MPPVPDYADQRPVYVQIADDIRDAIKAGKHRPGDRLPANRVLSDRYGASMATIRQALDVLRNEGVVATQSTRGTFVLNTPEEPESSPEFTAMTEQVRLLTERIAAVEGWIGREEERHRRD